MNRFSVSTLLMTVALGLAGVLTSAGAAYSGLNKSACGCTDCRCPDCSGGVCTCDVCECGSCGCLKASATTSAQTGKTCCAGTPAHK